MEMNVKTVLFDVQPTLPVLQGLKSELSTDAFWMVGALSA